MRRRGFTLIELLAVIVILAIIALIAVPIVINIINDSKKESLQRSIDLYVDHVQKAITKYQMTHPGFNPSTCTIEDKKLTCDGTEIEVEMKGQVPESGIITIENNKIKYRGLVLEGMEYTLKADGTVDVKKYVPPTPATGEDYKGYYADVDGDGTVDGIIYADLAHPKEETSWGRFNTDYAKYSYTKGENLNEYTVSNNTYKKNDGFGENKIIKLKKKKDNPRFYVMALEDFRTGSFEAGSGYGSGYKEGTYFWYKNADVKMNLSDTSTNFGKGYENTGKMIGIWEKNGEGEGSYQGATQDDHDIWKHIQTKYQEGWYIPSLGEWTAFADYFTSKEENRLTHNYESGSYVANSGNYSSFYGLSPYYWSSSQFGIWAAWDAAFFDGDLATTPVNGNRYVRLGATF